MRRLMRLRAENHQKLHNAKTRLHNCAEEKLLMTFSRRSTKRTSQDAFVIKKSDTRTRTAAVEIEKHFDGKVCKHLPSGKTCRILRYDVVSRMIEALSNCDVIALGSGRSFASSRNSAFSFSRRDRAAFLLFSFIAQRADKPEWKHKRKSISRKCSR